MDRIRRNERLAAMTRILVESPNKIFTLGTFCEMFGAAKSTLSEDIDILRGVFAQFHLGQLDTVTGAAGGVRYRAVLTPEDAYRSVKDLAQMLAAPGRVLPGGFIYMADIMAMLAASAHHRAAGSANKISFGVKEVGIRGVWRRDLTAARGYGTFETNVLDKRDGCRQGAERCISTMVRRSFSICGAETSGSGRSSTGWG